jgi:hypothetical protein
MTTQHELEHAWSLVRKPPAPPKRAANWQSQPPGERFSAMQVVQVAGAQGCRTGVFARDATFSGPGRRCVVALAESGMPPLLAYESCLVPSDRVVDQSLLDTATLYCVMEEIP